MGEIHGGVAHRLEQAAHNHLVVGSIPTAPTKENAGHNTPAFSLVYCYFIIFMLLLVRFNPQPKGTMMYLPTEEIVHVPVSAYPAITRELGRILDIEAARGVEKVTGVDWCLRRVLLKADALLQGGATEIDLEYERADLLTVMSDEEDVDWNAHFDEAVRRLEDIFAPHPDS